MLILLVKVALAPLAVLVASLLSRRLGPRAGGFFIGLPTTSVPFLLAVHLSMAGRLPSTRLRQCDRAIDLRPLLPLSPVWPRSLGACAPCSSQ